MNWNFTKNTPENPLFYEEWNDKSSELLFLCDEELQKVCRHLSGFDLSKVVSLKIHYESCTPSALTAKLRSIDSLKGLYSPMVAHENGYIPDFQSRYFTADFPYGLDIIRQIAELAQISVPNISRTMRWYRQVSKDTSCFDLRDYGINKIEDLYRFYQ